MALVQINLMPDDKSNFIEIEAESGRQDKNLLIMHYILNNFLFLSTLVSVTICEEKKTHSLKVSMF